MKILFITPLPPPIHGSAMVGQYIKESKLINQSCDADYINLSTSHTLSEIGKKPLLKLLRFFLIYVVTLWKLLIHRYDKCYISMQCYGIGFLKDAPLALLCKVFCPKLIIHHHTLGIGRYVNRPIYHWLYVRVYRNSKVILLSWRMYLEYQSVVQKKQVFIVPNGIDKLSKEDLSVKSVDNEVFHILFLSNMIESKGVYVLLDACMILKSRGLKFQCKYVGAESSDIDKSKFDSEVKKRGLSDVVSYEGTKFGDDKIQCYKETDVFIHPTYDDCMPLVILEAMQLGLPIVSTDIGCISDMVKDGVNGFICPQQDSEAIADKIGILIKNRIMREEMGCASKKLFKERFDKATFERLFYNKIFN